MFLKKVVVVSCLSLCSLVMGHEAQEYNDPIAYRSGELVGELTFEAWIQAAKERRNEVVELAQKITQVGKEYAMSFNLSFLHGYYSCLETKDVGVQFEQAELTRYQCTLVLACYYYWILQLEHALHVQNFEFLYSPHFEEKALERATILMYGELVPEIMRELKKTLEHDRLGVQMASRECQYI